MKSQMSAPIPPDPGYGCGYEFDHGTIRPRVRPEAEGIASFHRHGSVKELLEKKQPIKSRFGKPRKNHIKENILQVRHRNSDITPAKGNTCTKCGHILSARMQDSFHKKVDSKNFIVMNKINARRTPARAVHQVVAPKTPSPCKVGEVPKYLQVRKKMLDLQKKKSLDAPCDPSIPEGHAVMPSYDRMNTLQVLQHDKEALVSELLALPITCHTLKHKQRKMDIESKLSEIDDAIKIFSRPKVYVKLE